jgi:hypothetical protein
MAAITVGAHGVIDGAIEGRKPDARPARHQTRQAPGGGRQNDGPSVLRQGQDEGRDEQPGQDHDEERQAGHAGRLSQVWQQGLPHRRLIALDPRRKAPVATGAFRFQPCRIASRGHADARRSSAGRTDRPGTAERPPALAGPVWYDRRDMMGRAARPQVDDRPRPSLSPEMAASAAVGAGPAPAPDLIDPTSRHTPTRRSRRPGGPRS